jgi:hypothetical protein
MDVQPQVNNQSTTGTQRAMMSQSVNVWVCVREKKHFGSIIQNKIDPLA